ncbi:MAG: spermidine synthase [Steroidobacteraceae bacterium]|jgi:predicted membrane-bound spermidine synthase
MQTLDFMRRRLLFAVFVVSGFTGLIYESIWSHYLKLFLGHAAYAQTLVLAIFMGGMALGSWTVAHYSSRIRQLLWGYVLVEGLIGIFGIFFHQTFVAAVDFSFASVIPVLPAGLLIHAYKWSLAALLILPQSALLGMTFPLISGGLIRRWPERPGETLATLYFTNSLGAAIGVLVSGFVLIEAVGLPGTIRTAGVLNIALALVIWAIVRGQAEPAAAPQTASAPFSGKDKLARWFTVAAFLTGAASFMYELGWIRMLSLVLGSSTHSFELMLSAFIFGLAFGGLYVRRRIERIADPVAYLAYVMIAMGTLAALTLPAYNLTFDFMAWFLGTSAHTASGYVAFNAISQSIAALIMIPATFCAGMTLPLLTHELMRRGTGERAIGTIYSANTLGAIVGVLLTIHVLMPLVGVKGVILGGAGIHMALGLSRLFASRRYPSRTAAVAMAAAVGVFGFAIFVVNLDPAKMASGVYRTGSAALPDGATVTYLRDGKTATISLVELDGTVTIATNGKPDAGIQMGPGEATVDESTMVLAAAIPLSMHPHPARVANIGFGSGLTTHTLLTSGLVNRLDSIEIEPLMVEAARKGFGPRISNVFDDPRSHIVYEDAKTFFASARESYDLIVSEPSNPWVSGVATLFSDEFYGRIAQYLAPDGYFVQWMQVYETNIGILASVMKALAPHFGAYALYNTDDLDILIIASRGATLRAPDDRLLQSPQLRAELTRVGVQSVADIQLRKIGDNLTIGPLLQTIPVPPNSDFFPFVDLNAPRLRYMRENALELPALTLLPIPFLELLDGSAPRGATVEPAANSAIFRDRLVRRALEIRRAVSIGSLDDLDPLSASYLARIDMSRDRCAAKPAQNTWKNAVRNISDDTSAYLNPAELEEIWIKVMSSPCYRDVTGEHKTWADLLAAISQRNAPEIVKLGTELLGPHPSNAEDELAYLTTVTAAAYVRMGEIAQARNLLQAQWRRFNHAGQFDLALRDLLALTQSAGTETIAQAAP